MEQPEDALETEPKFEDAVDWTDFPWSEQTDSGTGHCTAQTQTVSIPTEEKETQTSNPVIMRLDSTRASSRQNHASSLEIDGLVTPLFQFDRQAPARISTSPTLRRMRRSTRRPQMDFRDPGKETPEPNLSHSKSTGNITYHGSQTSPGNTQTCPVAGSLPNCFPEEFLPEHLPSVSPSDGKKDEFNAHSLNNGVIGRMLEPQSARESVRFDHTEDSNEMKESNQKGLQERRRSSVVVSLPGLDVSPGDLFVSDGAADYLSQSTFSDTKKSKWPFSKRWTAKDKMKLLCDVEKCLSSVHIQDWRNCDFQQYKVLWIVSNYADSEPINT